MVDSALLEREYSNHGCLPIARRFVYSKICDLDLSFTKELEHLQTRRGVCALDFECNEGRYLLSGSLCGTIVIHDTQQQLTVKQTCPAICKIRPCSQTKASISRLQWYPHDTGIFTSSGSDSHLKIWDTNSLSVVEQFRFRGRVNFHTMGRNSTHCLIAVGSSPDPHVALCDMRSGSSSHILRGHRKSVLTIDWSPESEHILVSGSEDNQILLWDIRRASGPVLTFDQYNGAKMGASSSAFSAHHGHVTGVQYTTDGLFVVSCGSDNKLRMWDASSGKNTMVNYGKVKPIPPGVPCLFGLSAYGGGADPVISMGLDTSLVLYEGETGAKLKVLRGHYGTVQSCIFHPFNLEIYSGGSDSNILIWNPRKKELFGPRQRRSQNRITGLSLNQDEWSSDED